MPVVHEFGAQHTELKLSIVEYEREGPCDPGAA
jgi:hypothetical protein